MAENRPEQIQPREISPTTARDRFVAIHSSRAMYKLHEYEAYQPLYALNLLQEGPQLLLEGTRSDVTKGSVNNMAIGSLSGGFISPRPEAPIRGNDDYERMDYNFGQQELNAAEVTALIGDDFENLARQSISRVTGVYKEGSIQREILPGLRLTAHVVDENNRYGDQPSTTVPEYRVTTSYATVPLVAEAPITGRGLLATALEEYGKDFEKRFRQFVDDPASPARQDYWGNEITDSPTVPEIIDSILARNENLKSANQAADPIVIATSPELTVNEKLFVLATMKDALVRAGQQITDDSTSPIEDRIKTLGAKYMGLLAVDEAQVELESYNLDQSMKNREPVAPLTEQERDKILQRNLELLRLSLVPGDIQEIDAETQLLLSAISAGETRRNPDGSLEQALKVVYETGSGAIRPTTAGFLPGDFSRLITWLTVKGRATELDNGRWVTTDPGRISIRLIQPGEGPTLSEIHTAVTGEAAPGEDNRRILPERIIPGHSDLMGPREQWGQSELTPYTQGDNVLLTTVQRFNKQFGVKE